MGETGAKILLVEDNDLVREHVNAQLQGLGYTVITVRNGAEALEALREDAAIDLLFTDVVMPGGISGRDLVEQARQLRPKLPVLLTSGYFDRSTLRGGEHELPMLQKPYGFQDLAQKVSAALGKPPPQKSG
ncbi:MAG: response regulator [Xanthomonadales bacterium]|nr:response regulator [Xanthomonadales bacterium]